MSEQEETIEETAAEDAAEEEETTEEVVTEDEDTELTIEDIQPKMEVTGVVKKTTLMGAILDIEGHPALLHISQVVQGRKVGVENVEEVLSEGDEVTVYVMEVDREAGKLLVSMVKPPAVEWDEIAVGKVFTGTVVRLKKYGAFVDIGAERPGLVHVSELSSEYVEHPKDAVKRGEEVEVQVIGLDRNKNQIDLSMKALTPGAEPTVTDIRDDFDEDMPTAMAVAMQRALNQADEEEEAADSKKQSKKKRNELDGLLRNTLERHNSDS